MRPSKQRVALIKRPLKTMQINLKPLAQKKRKKLLPRRARAGRRKTKMLILMHPLRRQRVKRKREKKRRKMAPQLPKNTNYKEELVA